MNEAARRTGHGKDTILRWARDAGLTEFDRAQIVEARSERNKRAAAASFAKTAQKRAEARERIIDRLIAVGEGALIREGQIIASGGLSREDLGPLSQARERAIKSLELLSGRPTSRAEVGVAGMDRLLAGAAHAFQQTLEAMLARGMREELRQFAIQTYAQHLRELEADDQKLELDAGDVVDGEAQEVGEGERDVA